MTKFYSHCAGALVREIITEYRESFTPQQRRSMLGEVKHAGERGDRKTEMAVLKSVCKIMRFKVLIEHYDLVTGEDRYRVVCMDCNC
jgi:hypothetical protein